MLVDNALDQFADFLRRVCRFDSQRLLHEVDVRLCDLLERPDLLLDFRRAVRAVQTFQRVGQHLRVFVMMRMPALCNDFDIGLMLMDNALDQFADFLRRVRRFDSQRLLHEIDIRLCDLLERRNITLDLRRAVRAVQTFQRVDKLHDNPPFYRQTVEQSFNYLPEINAGHPRTYSF